MKFLKNPLFWAIIAFAGGMVIAGIGWDKNESTIPERTHGAETMMVTGCLMIAGALIYFFTAGNRKSN